MESFGLCNELKFFYPCIILYNVVFLLIGLLLCLQWDNQQLHLYADGMWELGSEHLAEKPQNCESPGEKVLLEEHAGGCANYPQTWSASCLISIILYYILKAKIFHMFCVQVLSTVTWSQRTLSLWMLHWSWLTLALPTESSLMLQVLWRIHR